jgi:hypothetical protein
MTYNESVRDKMTPVPKDDIISDFKSLPKDDKINAIVRMFLSMEIQDVDSLLYALMEATDVDLYTRLGVSYDDMWGGKMSLDENEILGCLTDDELYDVFLYITGLNESVRSRMTPKSEEDIRLVIKNKLNTDNDHIEVKIPEPKEVKKIRSLLDLSDEYNLDIDVYDDTNLMVRGDIVDVFNFIKFYVNYTMINKQNKSDFFIKYILDNTVGKVTESVRDKMTPITSDKLDTIFDNMTDEIVDILVKEWNFYREEDALTWILTHKEQILDMIQRGNPLINTIHILMMGWEEYPNEKTNEGIRDKMTPKSKETIDDSLKNMSKEKLNDILYRAITGNNLDTLEHILSYIDISDDELDLCELAVELQNMGVLALLVGKGISPENMKHLLDYVKSMFERGPHRNMYTNIIQKYGKIRE